MTLKGYQALAHWDVNTVIVSRHEEVFRYHIADDRLEKVFAFNTTIKCRIARMSKWARRLLRSDIRFGYRSGEMLLLVQNQIIYCLDMASRSVKWDVALPRGNRPLNMSTFSGVHGFDDGDYFGEYFSNPSGEHAHIFKITDGALKSVYTFPAGTINHIHNIIPDSQSACVWILVGDFGGAAAIYRATNNFLLVEKICGGSQQYRSCVAHPYAGGLLYATDSQFEANHIKMLQKVNNQWHVSNLAPLNGSCIFGDQIGLDYYFSTAVEAINEGNVISKYARNKRGPGIIDHRMTIVKGNVVGGFKEIYSATKDNLPFLLFQFGNLLFPTGVNASHYLIFTEIGSKENDFCTQIIKTK